METTRIVLRMAYFLKDLCLSSDGRVFASTFQTFLKNELFGMTPNLSK